VQHHLHQQVFLSSQSRFLPKSIPLSSSTHTSLCIIINAHTSRPQSKGNAQNTGNAYQQLSNREGKSHRVGWESTGREAIEEKERKMKRWKGIESICFLLKKRRNRAWVCCVWVAVYGFAVFSLWEKCRGFGFLCRGCLAKRLGRKQGRRLPSA